ncbi:LPXTG cell wall anchor domain-containing protein [Weissella koreensis]|uniref:LPXTG cell wall anchor domain-containing protein n=1 Tax=Weissella koreensis TaxID=165096 RepID=A0A7H1MNJ0_9LACO|nr:LPXTG cell wall anchor domain-containing protein [Weissella koreensis]QNT65026.1 LPXTG cell wall anchor domain-containing protein [Weissella koreensis]
MKNKAVHYTNDNNSPINNSVNNIVHGDQTLFPNTSAEKFTLTGVISVVIASLAGLLIWKKRK